MVKLTYGQASALVSPAITGLFNDSKRTFPMNDALRMADMIEQIGQRIKAYRGQIKKLVNEHHGTVEANGMVRYEKPEDQQAFTEAVNSLNEEVLEINGYRVKPKKNWPDLSLTEATILRPILDIEDHDDRETGPKRENYRRVPIRRGM